MKLHYLLTIPLLLVASPTSTASRPTPSTSGSSWNSLLMNPTAFIAGCGVVGAVWHIDNLRNAHKKPVNSSAQPVLETVKEICIMNNNLCFKNTHSQQITDLHNDSSAVVGVLRGQKFDPNPIQDVEIVHVFPKGSEVVRLSNAQAAIKAAIAIGKQQTEFERLNKLNKVQKTAYIMRGAAIGITCGLAGLQVWSMLPHRPQIAEHCGTRLVELKGYKFQFPYITLWKK